MISNQRNQNHSLIKQRPVTGRDQNLSRIVLYQGVFINAFVIKLYGSETPKYLSHMPKMCCNFNELDCLFLEIRFMNSNKNLSFFACISASL